MMRDEELVGVRGRPLTEPPERDKAVIQAIRGGMSRVDAGRHFGISRERVGQIMGRWGGGRIVPVRYSDDLIQKARALWDQGLSQRAVAKRLGIPFNTVAGFSTRFSWPRRDVPENFRRKVANPEALG